MASSAASVPEQVIWDVIDAYFNHGGGAEAMSPLVQHQIGSYNEFIDRKLGQIIHGFNPIQICHQYREDLHEFVHKIYIRILNPSLSKPFFLAQDGAQMLMTPHFARMNNLTYASNLMVDMSIHTETINEDGVTERKEATIPHVNIGKFPIMVRSKLCTLTQMPGTAEGGGKHECRYDFGGYFIINGNEKVVISQDRISENRTVVFSQNVNMDGLSAEIRSMPDGVFLPPKTCALHLSSKPNQYGRIIRLSCTFLRAEIPLFVMFRALGIESDEDIMRFIIMDDSPKNKRLVRELAASADDASDVHTQADALRILQRSMTLAGTPREYLDQPAVVARMLKSFIENDFLPHTGHAFNRKALYLGYMTRKLLRTYLGYQPFDNRDSYIHKRIDTPGVLIGNLFRQCYGKMIKEMRNLIQRELHVWRAGTIAPQNIISSSNVHRFLKQTVIESGMRYSLSTGNWGVKSLGSFQNIRQGVAQVLNRMSYYSTLSHLRRVNTPMEKNGKLVQPRKLENTQYGMICPAETPEGGAVGLVKNMAMGSQITNSQSSAYLRTCIETLGTSILDDSLNADAVRAFLATMGSGRAVQVMVNGDIMGFHTDPTTFFAKLKSLKRMGELSPYTAVAWNVQHNTIALSTEAGRMCRPVFIVDAKRGGLQIATRLADNPSKATSIKTAPFATFLAPLNEQVQVAAGGDASAAEGFIEILDVDEVDHSMIAMSQKDLSRGQRGTSVQPAYTHCEIHPSMMLGVLGVNIPFANHNQAPRNAYQCSMGKQAVGTYMSNFNNRIDTMGHVLNYPQAPIVRTRLGKYTHTDTLPSGVNAIVAIMTYTGFNQEDSVMLNQSALDRGMFTSTYYKSYRDQCSKNHSTGEEEIFTRPEPDGTSHLKPFNYDKVGEDGFVPKNTAVTSNDVLVGKVMPIKVAGVIHPRDASLFMKHGDEGRVDMNYQGVNADGYKFCKIRLRQFRKPTIGDKVASRSAQKGTVGMIYKQHDMPFSKDGLVPDIIINPHAIPSRMTAAQLMECLMGKACAAMGAKGDATPFRDVKMEELADVLQSYGMERYGNEILYDGRSGMQIQTEIFIGPTYYQRLKHMVCDKLHARGSSGPVVMLTRQPAEGRARNGGLRFGEMERDAIVAHGASAFLKERMLDVSDNYRVFVCRKCGLMCTANPERSIYKCTSCKNGADITQARIPYSMKLLIQELMTMSVAPRFIM